MAGLLRGGRLSLDDLEQAATGPSLDDLEAATSAKAEPWRQARDNALGAFGSGALDEAERQARQTPIERTLEQGRRRQIDTRVAAGEAAHAAEVEANADTWAETGRKALARIWPNLKAAAGGGLQALIEGSAMDAAFDPTKPLTGQERADLQAQLEAGLAVARERKAVPGQKLYENAARDLEANGYNPGSSYWKRIVGIVADSAPQMAGAAALTLLTRNPEAGAASLGAVVGGQQYGESREQGRSVAASNLDALVNGAAETLGENIPLGMLMKPGGTFLRNTLKTAGAEGVQEIFTQIIQSGYDKGVLHPDMTWGEVRQQILDAGVAGFVMGGGLSVGTQGARRAFRPYQPLNTPKIEGLNLTGRPEFDAAIAEAAQPTPEDIASPLDTSDIVAGKVEIARTSAQAMLDQAAKGAGFPTVGQRVEIQTPEGQDNLTGTLREIFGEGADQGLDIELDTGRPYREYLDNIRDAGHTIVPIGTGAKPGTPGAGLKRLIRASESSGNDRATNPNSSAKGPYQFLDSTWEALGGDPAKRFDPAENDRIMDKLLAQNARALSKAGFEASDGNLYLAHVLGAQGAINALRNPEASAREVLGDKVVNANPFMRDMTAGDVAAWAEQRVGGKEATPAPVFAETGQPADTGTDFLNVELNSTKDEIGGETADAGVGPPSSGDLGGGGGVSAPVTVSIPETRAGASDGVRVAPGADQVSAATRPQAVSQESSSTPSGDGTRAAPIEATEAAHVDQAAANVAAPTEAQKEAGNYQKGHVRVQGLDITIETPKGAERSGVDPNGKPWSVNMPDHYGYVKRTEGADGDHVDVYVGPNPQADTVYVVDQHDHATGKFDEHKAMLGYDSEDGALAAYDAAFSDGKGPRRRKNVTPMSVDQFKDWLARGNTKKPAQGVQPDLLGGPDMTEAQIGARETVDQVVADLKAEDEDIDLAQVVGELTDAWKDRAKDGNGGSLWHYLGGHTSPVPRWLADAAGRNGALIDELRKRAGLAEHPGMVVARPLSGRTDSMQPAGTVKPRELTRNEKVIVAQNEVRASGYSMGFNADGDFTISLPGGFPKKAVKVASGAEAAKDIDAVIAKAKAEIERRQKMGAKKPNLVEAAQQSGKLEIIDARTPKAGSDAGIRENGAQAARDGLPRQAPSWVTADQTHGMSRVWYSGYDSVTPSEPETASSPDATAGASAPASSEIAALLDKAQPHQAELAAFGKDLPGFSNPGLKSAKRIAEKVAKEGYGSPSELKDIVRGGFFVDSMADAERIAEAVKDRFTVADDKGWRALDSGYFDHKLIVDFGDGVKGEIQIVPSEIWKAKKGGVNDLYKAWRAISDKESVEAERLREQMFDAYSNAVSGGDFANAFAASIEASGNSRAKASFEKVAPSFEFSPGAGRQEPSRQTPANPRPSSEPLTTGRPSISSNVTGASSEPNVGATTEAGKPSRFANNKLFTEDKVAAARARMAERMNRLNSGVDPEMLLDGIIIAGAHVEAGVRNFAVYAKLMRDEFGNKITPYLLTFWEGVRNYPGIDTKDMTPPDIARATVDLLSAESAPEGDLARSGDGAITPAEEGNASATERTGPEGADRAGDEGAGAADAPATEGVGRAERRPERAGEDRAGSLRPGDDGRGAEGGQRTELPGDGERADAGAKPGGGKRARAGDRVSKPRTATGGVNYSAPKGSLTRQGSWRATAERNLDIVELVKTLEAEGREATPDEQALLAKFTGWGASELRNGLFPSNGIRRNAAGEREIVVQPWERGEWVETRKRAAKLLTGADLETALQSVQYAHYTAEPVIRSIWDAMGRMGFQGGRLLEPGMGIGLFMAAAPEQVAAASQYTGIELDAFTAKVARYLLPNEPVSQGDYVQAKLPNGFFDAAIGNPPFSATKVTSDPDYRKFRLALHDYFFAKTIDKVRPGGLMVFVTSRYTMDKANDVGRKYLADRADLLGAIRLPQTAFKENAGTEVVTDVLFFQKRAEGAEPGGESWLGLDQVKAGDQKVLVNEYFAKHPKMVLGRHALTGSMYRDKEYTVEPAEGDIAKQFAKAVQNLPEAVYVEAPRQASESAQAKTYEADMRPASEKEGGLYLKDGKVFVREHGVGKHVSLIDKITPEHQTWLKGYVGVRDALKQAQKDQLDGGDWESSLKALNKAYDGFVKKHGPIRAFTTYERTTTDDDGVETTNTYRRFKNQRLLDLDVESPLVMALEKITDDNRIVKGPFLLGRTLDPPVRPKIETAADALAVSLDDLGKLDLAYIARLAKRTREEVIDELGDQIYETPAGEWQTSDEYLSGDVLAKLEEAEIAAKSEERFRRNVEALSAVQPKPLTSDQIGVKLGAGWVPVQHIREFAQEVVGLGEQTAKSINYEPTTAQWGIDLSGQRGMHARQAIEEYGTTDRSPAEILTSVLNSQTIKVTRKEDKKTYTDEKATAAANEAAKKLSERFQTWVWEDSKRATEIVDLYNRQFNNLAPRAFDGSHLTLPGLSSRFKLYPHQKRAVWRIIQTGNTYLNHAVGAGKTFEMIVAGMEQKRLGLIKKPMYVVPNHMLNQFAGEFMEAYPAANIMVADDKAFHTDNRKRFMAQAALNNPDAIIITHSSFGKIGTKPESRAQIVEDMIVELEAAMEGADTRHTRSKIEKQIENITRRFEGKTSAAKDQALTFEEMGVDFLFVDEAHEFRKLDFATNRQVKGIDPNGSQKALDLYIKTRFLAQKNPTRSLVMASGTPVTNTMAELYTVMRYLGEAQLEKDGLRAFDAWANMFGEVAAGYEQNAAGGYEIVERFAKFVNVPELMKRVRAFMDVLTSDQLGDLVKRPKVNGGVPHNMVTPPVPALNAYMKGELDQRIRTSKAWKPTRDQPANPDPIIAINTDARLASIDMRFIRPDAENDAGSKLNQMIDQIIKVHHEIKDISYPGANGKADPVKGGTQIVFSAVGFGEGAMKNRGFDLRGFLEKRLVAGGIKKAEIAWMSDANTDAKKEALQKAVRAGKVKVLIGSPKNMGTGLNVQLRLKALHYLSPPWYPADVEQPHGRIVRQGNLNEDVDLYWYATKGTYDSTQWSMVSRKARFIEQAMSGDDSVRSLDDISEANQYEMAAALAAGDERVIQVASLGNEITRLERLEGAHFDEQRQLKFDRKSTIWDRDAAKEKIALFEKAVEAKGTGYPDFAATIGGKTFTRQVEAAQAIIDAVGKYIETVEAVPEQGHEIGRYLTHPILVLPSRFASKGVAFQIGLKVGPATMRVTDDLGSMEGVAPIGLGQKLVNALLRVPTELAGAKARLAESEATLKKIDRKLGTPFPQKAELSDKIAERARLQAELAAETKAKDEAAQKAIEADKPVQASARDMDRRGFLKGAAATVAVATFTKGGKVFASTPELNAIIEKASGEGGSTLREGLDWIAQNAKDRAIQNIARKLAPLAGDLKLYATVPDPSLEELNNTGRLYPDGLSAAAGLTQYGPDGLPEVWLAGRVDAKVSGWNERTFIHEALHAAIMRTYGMLSVRAAGNTPAVLKESSYTLEAVPYAKADKIVAEIGEIWRDANAAFHRLEGEGKKPPFAVMAAVQSPDELLSWALESPEVQAFLREQPSRHDERSLWTRFVDWVRSLFTGAVIGRSMFDDVLDATNRLLDEARIDVARAPRASQAQRVLASARVMPDAATPDGDTVADLTEQAKGLLGDVRGKWDDFRTAMQDRMLPVLRAQAAAEQVMGRALHWHENPYMAEELMTGRVGAQLDTLQKDYVGPLFDAMKANKINAAELESYLYARHAPERNAAIDKINPDMEGHGSGMSDVEAQAILNRIKGEGRTEAFEHTAKYVWDMLKFARDLKADSDLLSEEQLTAWEDTYQHYVPLKGFEELDGVDARPNRGSGISVRGPESKRAFGRRSQAKDILAHAIMQAEEAIIRAQKNEVARKLYNLAQAAPDAEFWKLNKVTSKRRLNPETGLVEYYFDRNLQPEDADYTISLKIDGKEKRITLNKANPAAVRVAEAMRRLNEGQADKAIRLLGAVNRWLSHVNTTLNPEFVISNAFRDLQEGTINLQAEQVRGITRGVLKDYFPAMYAATKGAFGRENGRWGQWYAEFVEDGGKIAFNQLHDLSSLQARMEREVKAMQAKALSPGTMALHAKGALKAFFNTVENVNSGVENGIRLATYKNAREKGMTREQAASLAKNLTINFNRKGGSNWALILNSAYLFYNASVQGSARMVLAIGKSRRVQAIVATAVLTGFMLDALNRLLSPPDDDDEQYYDKIGEWEKEHNLILMQPGGKGRYWKLPLPYGYGTFFTVGRSMSELVHGKNPLEVGGHLVGAIVDAFNPIGGTQSLLNFIAPSVLDPVVDLAQNKDFAGRPIVPNQPDRNAKVPESQLYWSSTSPIWRSVSETLNDVSGGDKVRPGAIDISPEVFDHLFGQVTGAAGQFYERPLNLAAKAFDPQAEITAGDIPFARKVVGGKPAWYDRSLFYARLQSVEQATHDLKAYAKQGDVEGLKAFVGDERDKLMLGRLARQSRKALGDLRKAQKALDQQREKGVLDKAGYNARTRELKDVQERIIVNFNAEWNHRLGVNEE